MGFESLSVLIQCLRRTSPGFLFRQDTDHLFFRGPARLHIHSRSEVRNSTHFCGDSWAQIREIGAEEQLLGQAFGGRSHAGFQSSSGFGIPSRSGAQFSNQLEPWNPQAVRLHRVELRISHYRDRARLVRRLSGQSRTDDIMHNCRWLPRVCSLRQFANSIQRSGRRNMP